MRYDPIREQHLKLIHNLQVLQENLDNRVEKELLQEKINLYLTQLEIYDRIMKGESNGKIQEND